MATAIIKLGFIGTTAILLVRFILVSTTRFNLITKSLITSLPKKKSKTKQNKTKKLQCWYFDTLISKLTETQLKRLFQNH